MILLDGAVGKVVVIACGCLIEKCVENEKEKCVLGHLVTIFSSYHCLLQGRGDILVWVLLPVYSSSISSYCNGVNR